MRPPRAPTRSPRAGLSGLSSVRPPIAVALTGGIGAGKSEALAAFARHGAATTSSDGIVHRLLAEDPGVRSAVVERFGAAVLDVDGGLDRAAVGRVVFGVPEELAWLEALLHPLVVAEQAEWRAALASRPEPPAVCVIEIPLLYETGGESRFDAVVVVTAPPVLREARARRPDLALREQRLIPDDEKVRRADFVYVNDGTLDELDAFVVAVLERLTEARRAG
jgi:dephospho-CoA kinase